MNRLWTYQDYVEHLSHTNTFVRRWAFEAIEKQFPRKVTSEVSNLIGDSDEHLACMAPRYLASHGVTEFIPDIIESFKLGENNVPSNCAMALGDLLYEPALDDILERLSNVESLNTFLGILYYLGKVRQDDCRQVLIKVLNESADNHYVDMVAYHLLEHGNSEDMARVLEIYLAQLSPKHHNDMFLKHVMNSLGAEDLYDELTDYSPTNILELPLKVLEDKLMDRPGIEFPQEPFGEIIRLIQKEDYQSVCTTLMFEAQNTVRRRFPDNKPNDSDYLDRIFELDSLNVSFLKELSKQSAHWESARQNEKIGRNHIAAIISSYFSIIEREGYFRILDSGDYSVENLINILKDASKEFPETLLNRLIDLSPINELKSALSEELLTWGDIWIVRLMGKIGNEEFVPDLIRVVRETDGMAYIHTDAVSALNGIDESGHERIFSAIADGDIKDPFDVCALLEHLPYSESFDHAVKIWIDDGEDSLDSYESYAVCLERIGDARGIESLRGILFEGNIVYVGDSLETLCALHKKEIPELESIREERKIRKERQRKRMMELDELAEKASKRESSNAGTQASSIKPFKRDTPKVGRNAPCPCGSGKKYKKCCLNKK